MAGGDLLYILAFIILPTAVLVSCVWALILLRKGVLLPARPVPGRDPAGSMMSGDSSINDGSLLVEETGEHATIDPAQAPAAPAAHVAGSDVPSPATTVVPENEPPAYDQPPTERTQELTVLPVDDVVASTQPVTQPAIVRAESSGDSELETPSKAVVEADASSDDLASESASLDPLLIPLDDLSREKLPSDASASETQPAVERATTDASLPATGPRRPSRRVAQRRPADDGPARPRPRTGQRRVERRTGDEA